MTQRPILSIQRLSCLLFMAALQGGVGCGEAASADTKSSTTRSASQVDDKPVGDASVTPTLPDDTAGKGCTQDADCAPGTCLSVFQPLSGGMMNAPGGYCSLTCMTSTECGVGGTCSGAFAGFGGIGATTRTMPEELRDGRRVS